MFRLEICNSFSLIIMHIVWLALIIFLLSFARRLVKAVEKIAERYTKTHQ